MSMSRDRLVIGIIAVLWMLIEIGLVLDTKVIEWLWLVQNRHFYRLIIKLRSEPEIMDMVNIGSRNDVDFYLVMEGKYYCWSNDWVVRNGQKCLKLSMLDAFQSLSLS